MAWAVCTTLSGGFSGWLDEKCKMVPPDLRPHAQLTWLGKPIETTQ